MNVQNEDLQKPVTLGVLLEYTDSFLIPRIGDIVSEQIKSEVGGIVREQIKSEVGGIVSEQIDARVGDIVSEKIKIEVKPMLAEQEYKLKSYIDDKFADYHSDIFKRLDRKEGKEKTWRWFSRGNSFS